MKKKINKNILILAVILIVILMIITCFLIFKTKALYKINDQHNFISSKVNFFTTQDFIYTGSSQEFIVPRDGYYQIELWGASGAGIYGGRGGYTKGFIKLNKDEKLYFYVGERQTIGSNTSLWNGGGSYTPDKTEYYVSLGGSSTDVRLISGVWNDSTSLRSRIMVAAGGGGSASTYGGHASGLYGDPGTNATSSTLGTTVNAGVGGKQSSGGNPSTNYESGWPGSQPTAGIFGIGGTGNKYGASGGSGYYGGGGGGIIIGAISSGGSGSSYISGYAGVNSVLQSGGTTAQPLHSHNTIHYSGKYFINGEMQANNFRENGKAKITYIDTLPPKTNLKLNNVRYIKTCNSGSVIGTPKATWLELQVIKDGINLLKNKAPIYFTVSADVNQPYYLYSNITDGNIDNQVYGYASVAGKQCLVYDLGSNQNVDEIVEWGWFYDGRTYYDKTLSVGSTYSTGTTPLATVLHAYSGTAGYAETSQGKRYTAWD